jgi:hypothetical protein
MAGLRFLSLPMIRFIVLSRCLISIAPHRPGAVARGFRS